MLICSGSLGLLFFFFFVLKTLNSRRHWQSLSIFTVPPFPGNHILLLFLWVYFLLIFVFETEFHTIAQAALGVPVEPRLALSMLSPCLSWSGTGIIKSLCSYLARVLCGTIPAGFNLSWLIHFTNRPQDALAMHSISQGFLHLVPSLSLLPPPFPNCCTFSLLAYFWLLWVML